MWYLSQGARLSLCFIFPVIAAANLLCVGLMSREGEGLGNVMDVREIAIERWISPVLAEKEREGEEETGKPYVLSKHVEHLSILFN